MLSISHEDDHTGVNAGGGWRGAGDGGGSGRLAAEDRWGCRNN